MFCRLREVEVSLSILSGPLYSILCCGKKDPKKTVAQRSASVLVCIADSAHLMPFNHLHVKAA